MLMPLHQHARTKLTAYLAILCATVSLLGLAFFYGWFKSFELSTWDARLRAVARPEKADRRIKVVMIDESSIEFMSREQKLEWPWPREIYLPLLSYLKAAGARGVAFDLLFADNNQAFGMDDGSTFAEAIVNAAPLTVVSAISARITGEADEQSNVRKKMLRERVAKIQPYEQKFLLGLEVPRFDFVTLPFEALFRASPMLGNVRSFPDQDKVFRRLYAGGYIDDIPILSLPFALYHATQPDLAAGRELKSFADTNGQYIIRFHGPVGTYDEYSMASVIMSGVSLADGQDPVISLSEFKDSFVLIGANAPALLDLRPSPFGAEYPGVLINAAALDNILNKDFIREVPLALSMAVAAVALSLICYVAMYGGRLQWITLVLVYLAWLGVCFVAADLGWWLPMVPPLFMMVVATVSCLGFQYTFEGRQHRFIKNAFQYYVTPEVIDRIIADPSMLSLGGERRELTIFFSDIAGFTTLSEKMEPAKLVRFLNKFLSEMTDIILSSGGTIDKYEGDAIIAFWNAPLSVPDHQLRGVRAALECQRRLSALAGTFKTEFGVEVQMRVGLNTGPVTVGNFGSSTRFNYTMIGDAANLASRLEGANKVFGSRILVAETTHVGARHNGILWRKLGEIKVVGKSKTVSVFEPLDSKRSDKLLDQIEDYNSAIEAFEARDLERAYRFFSMIEGDPVSRAYLDRIAKAQQEGGLQTHVWNLTEK